MIWEFKHVVFSRCTDAYLLVFVAGSRTPSGPLFCVSNGMYCMKNNMMSYLLSVCNFGFSNAVVSHDRVILSYRLFFETP